MGVTVLFPSRHSGNHRSGLLDWAAAAPRRHSVHGCDALNVREVPIVAFGDNGLAGRTGKAWRWWLLLKTCLRGALYSMASLPSQLLAQVWPDLLFARRSLDA
jgi:hypothetical protein